MAPLQSKQIQQWIKIHFFYPQMGLRKRKIWYFFNLKGLIEKKYISLSDEHVVHQICPAYPVGISKFLILTAGTAAAHINPRG